MHFHSAELLCGVKAVADGRRVKSYGRQSTAGEGVHGMLWTKNPRQMRNGGSAWKRKQRSSCKEMNHR
jgi:hypothetical protein